MLAAKQGDLWCVSLLLNAGATPDLKDFVLSFYHSFMTAICYNHDSNSLTECFFSFFLSLFFFQQDKSSLYLAVVGEHKDCVCVLLTAGVAVDSPDNVCGVVCGVCV